MGMTIKECETHLPDKLLSPERRLKRKKERNKKTNMFSKLLRRVLPDATDTQERICDPESSLKLSAVAHNVKHRTMLP